MCLVEDRIFLGGLVKISLSGDISAEIWKISRN